ncbi:MAG: hypothetical protein MUC53_07040 [Candidatus Contendobacter sp.]|nr:hypothetical protein [Candidatus Contendobacter sp.]
MPAIIPVLAGGNHFRAGITEPESHAGQHAEAQHPQPVVGGLGQQNESGSDQQATDHGGIAWSDAILALTCQDHRKSEHQAANRIRVVDGGQIPLETVWPSLLDGIADRTLENTPGIKDAQRQIDASSRQYDGPALAIC